MHDVWLDELKARGYHVRPISDVHWRIGRVSFYPHKGTIVRDGQCKEPLRGFIALLKVLEWEGALPVQEVGPDIARATGKKASPSKPKRQAKADFSFAKLKIENCDPPECVNWVHIARACVSSKRLTDDQKAWVAELLRLRAAFELDSISFTDEKRLIRLYRTSTRILKPDTIAQPWQQIESIEIVCDEDSDS